ncbi:N-acetyltransferase family protein [Pseudoroseicyclus sp. H15]
MSSDLVIRPLEADDASSWRRLWAAYLDFYESSVTEEVYASTFTRLADPAVTEMQALLAVQNGTPVGLVHYVFHRSTWVVEPVCYLQDLFADPAVRGQGVGRALIEAVYAASDAAGAGKVYWMTQNFNATARQLYDRIGTLSPFIVYERKV